ncbi:TonB-dependent receptor [Novosphingobium sp. 9]|uniref:TonB-dependent receptor n=1 Tax=Novosphingobium sp. 9 TaxID=2025349 RepID=UPI0021B5D595|nr:TonB-dependent receptor [Novosphingobium sp. 9]
MATSTALSFATVAHAQTQPAAVADDVPGDIVVTAQKRDERSIDVPASITSIGGAKLEAMQVKQLTDLVSTVPGLSISNYGGPGMNSIQLRGLSGSFLDDFAGPLVATYIDDLPVGSSTAAGRGNLFTLDLQPYDMDAVEILRGPQGTLYGANSMGGLIKYTLKKPDLNKFEGRAGATVGYTNGAGGLSWSPRAAINAPIVDGVLAVRASAFYSKTPGYIDNVGTGVKNANSSKSYGGRFALLWQATDRLKLHGGVLYQKSDADDVATVLVTADGLHPVYGPQKTYSDLPTAINQKTVDYTAGADYDLDFATLTTSAGWVAMDTLLNQDLTEAYAAYNPAENGKTRFGLASTVRKFTSETRLTSSAKARLEYTVGFYYTNERAGEDTNFQALDANLVPVPDFTLLQGHSRYKYKEVAGFANATYKFSDKFDLSAGGRYTNYSQVGAASSTGLLGGATNPADTGHVGVGIWSVNGRYHFNPDFLFYGRFATGYRPGAFNSPNSSCDIPAASDPDRTDNYEAGIKGLILDRKVNFELTAYHIKWKNMQLNVSQVQGDSTCIFVTNGGSATSNGVEFSGGYQATPDLRLSATATYQDAYLDDDLPLSGGIKGDTLPLSSKWQYSVAADWKREVKEGTSLLAGASFSHKDPYVNFFEGTGHPYPFKSMNLANAYVGAELGSLTARLTVQNLFENRSYVGMQYPFRPDFGLRAVPVQPRTVTLSLDYKF